MKLTKALLRERGIHNSHNLCSEGGGKLFIWYRSGSRGRGCVTSAWVIAGINFNTDPDAPWYNYGQKTFSPFKLTRAGAMEEAKAWASEKYGISEWERDVFGGWQDKHVMDALREKITSAKVVKQ